MAFIITVCAVFIDLRNGTNGSVFMFSVPFIVFLITGKQFLDKNKTTNETDKDEKDQPNIGYVIDNTIDKPK